MNSTQQTHNGSHYSEQQDGGISRESRARLITHAERGVVVAVHHNREQREGGLVPCISVGRIATLDANAVRVIYPGAAEACTIPLRLINRVLPLRRPEATELEQPLRGVEPEPPAKAAT